MVWVFVLVAGAASAWCASRTAWHRWHAVAGVALALVALCLLRLTDLGGITVLVAVVGGVGAGLAWPRGRRGARRGTLLVGAASGLAVGLLLWVGANDPAVGWFGDVHVHGPRDGDEVAITFDDGPDPRWTPAVAAILDRHGVPGTFFLVGRALDARPDVARRLHERGHVLANHSYHHDHWRWLDPRYPELERTQDAFRRNLGICPALFRPPHGQRTPFMLRRVSDAGLATVTWDVSAQDWSDTDGRRVARRVLDRVRPGSIILLHDGLDGTPADRAVLGEALPRILAGLEDKGLTPVRLDDLLELPAYQPC